MFEMYENEKERRPEQQGEQTTEQGRDKPQAQSRPAEASGETMAPPHAGISGGHEPSPEGRGGGRRPRGTAAMDPETRREVARKGGLAVSRNRQHMAEIGRKGGQTVSKNRDHMAQIGRKGGEASRGHR